MTTKHPPGPVETLARLALQSDRYRDDPDFRDAVDAVLGDEGAEQLNAELLTAIACYLGEYDNPVPDYILRRKYRNDLRAALPKAEGSKI